MRLLTKSMSLNTTLLTLKQVASSKLTNMKIIYIGLVTLVAEFAALLWLVDSIVNK